MVFNPSPSPPVEIKKGSMFKKLQKEVEVYLKEKAVSIHVEFKNIEVFRFPRKKKKDEAH